MLPAAKNIQFGPYSINCQPRLLFPHDNASRAKDSFRPERFDSSPLRARQQNDATQRSNHHEWKLGKLRSLLFRTVDLLHHWMIKEFRSVVTKNFLLLRRCDRSLKRKFVLRFSIRVREQKRAFVTLFPSPIREKPSFEGMRTLSRIGK